MSEKYLKANNNSIDAAIGDLLAVTALGDDEPPNGTTPFHLLQKRRGSKQQLSAPGAFQSTLTTPPNSVMGIPSTVGSATSTVGGASSLGPGLKDPMYQQLAALQAQIFPISGQQSQALQNQLLLQQMQFMQMQRYFLGGGGVGTVGSVGGVFPGIPNLQSYQKLLSQQLGQLQLNKQQLQQFKVSSGNPSSSHQQMISVRLNFINQSISQINQELVILSQISSQQKDAAKNQDGKLTPVGHGSPQIGRSTPPVRNKADFKPGSGMPLRTQSANSLQSLNGAVDLAKGMPYGMQSLSLNPPQNVSQSSSARSVSRLQQIISGSASSDNLTGLAERQAVAAPPPPPLGPPGTMPRHSHSFSTPGLAASTPTLGPGSPYLGAPASSPLSSGMGPFPSSATNTTTTAAASFHTQKSVEDIQEFRPGVPWQPRAQPTEPAQVYAKPTPSSASIGPPFDFKPQSMTKSSPSSAFVLPLGTMPKAMASRGGGNKFLYRHNSVGSSSPFYPSSAVQPIGSHPGPKYGRQVHDTRQSWTTPSPMPDTRVPPFAQPQGRSYPARRASQGSSVPRTLPGPFGPSYPTFSGQNSQPSFGGRKQQQRMPHPPSMHTPTGNFPPGPYPVTTAGFGSGPSGTQHAPTQRHSSSSGLKWGSTVGEPRYTPASAAPWGAADGAQRGWDQGGSAQMWTSTATTTGSSGSRKTYTSGSSSPSTTSPTDLYSVPPTSASVQSYRAAGNAMWGQDGLRSPRSDSTMLSPEPTFAEWQAGKKARISVFKLPSNPPSNWLVIRNITSQV